MKLTHGLFAISTIITLPCSALAEDADESEWSIGAGLSSPGATYVFFGPVGVLGSGPTTLANLTLERKLSPSLWLMLQADGGLTAASSNIESQGVSSDQRAVLADVLGGLRWAITPDDPLVISAFFLAGGSYAWSGATMQGRDFASATIGARAQAGGMIEHEIVEDVALRLSAKLLTLAWNGSRWNDGSGPEQRTNGFSAFLSLSPALELRFLL